jgi:hypothetical protein
MEQNNLSIYEKLKTVPVEAQKPIAAGRLKGFTDINPMWRIKKLTETFGICGFGWKYLITKQWIELGGKDEKAAFVNIDLFVKIEEKWSEAIPGTGGSSFIASEKNGLYTSDECFKMALTDAISVACKSLGMGAEIYFQKDRSKYDNEENKTNPENPNQIKTWLTENQYKSIAAGLISPDEIVREKAMKNFKAFQVAPFGMKKEYLTELQKLIK